MEPDDLIRALCNTISEYQELSMKCWGSSPEECKELMTMDFPLIQTTIIQNAIKNIGNMEFSKKVAGAQIISYLDRFNNK